ncbi:MAG: hypothetical protein DPW16_18970 [Chloroflexi bacterium]|nr:hypothetical protein [Chloroflexota bacterium]
MTKYFSPMVDKYLSHWICQPTWDSMHPKDMERFYIFLKALQRYSKRDWFSELNATLLRAAKDFHPSVEEDLLAKTIGIFLEKAEVVLNYAKAEFPNPVVEMRNPFEVRGLLTTRKYLDRDGNEQTMLSDDEIEEILIKNFGKNWRDTYRKK